MAIKTLKNQLKAYLDKVNNIIKIDKAFLVGSYATNTAKKESDVDLLILSNEFKKMSFDDRLKILYRQTVNLDIDLHIHPVTEKELKLASNLTSLGAMRNDPKYQLL